MKYIAIYTQEYKQRRERREHRERPEIYPSGFQSTISTTDVVSFMAKLRPITRHYLFGAETDARAMKEATKKTNTSDKGRGYILVRGTLDHLLKVSKDLV